MELTNTSFDNYELLQSNNSIMIKYKGNRIKMEDYHLTLLYKNIQIFGIFDGHGGNLLSKTLPTLLEPIHKLVYQFYKKSINKETFTNQINQQNIYIDKYFIKPSYKNQGSTLHLLYITPGSSIILINVGDSKSIIVHKNNIILETIQHRPSHYIEYDRIIRNGDNVSRNENTIRINNKLSVSRSFGDFRYKYINNKYNGLESTVSVDSDIYVIDIEQNSYIIMASDGLWDNVSQEYIINTIQLYKNMEIIIKYLLNRVLLEGSNDNITIIIIKL